MLALVDSDLQYPPLGNLLREDSSVPNQNLYFMVISVSHFTMFELQIWFAVSVYNIIVVQGHTVKTLTDFIITILNF